MRPMRLLTAVLIIAVVAACGGDSDDQRVPDELRDR
jgi:hypothetical protein